jgi:hypothetical protein
MLSVPFAFLNAGKRGVMLDSGTPAGTQIAHELVRAADVVLWSEGTFDPTTVPDLPERQIRDGAGAYGSFPAEASPTTAFTRLHAGSSGYLIPGATGSVEDPARTAGQRRAR